jgi:hypothetical protein
MISTSFLNLCFTILLQKNEKIDETVTKDIYDIISFYKANSEKIPLSLQKKFSLICITAKLRIDGKDVDETVDNISSNEGFKESEQLIKQVENCNFTNDKLELALKRIKERKKLITILKDLPNFETVISQFNNNSYDDIEEFINSYERMISSAYTRLSEEKRNQSITKVSELDLLNDNFEYVLNQIQQSYSGENSITRLFSIR